MLIKLFADPFDWALLLEVEDLEEGEVLAREFLVGLVTGGLPNCLARACGAAGPLLLLCLVTLVDCTDIWGGPLVRGTGAAFSLVRRDDVSRVRRDVGLCMMRMG